MKQAWAMVRQFLRVAGRQARLYFVLLVVGIACVCVDRSNGTLDDIGAGLIVAAVLYFALELLSQRQQRITRSDELVLPATFRVNIGPVGERLRAGPTITNGVMIGEAWKVRADRVGHAVHGPYLRRPLLKGRYIATFRLKIASTGVDRRQVLILDVVSAVPKPGQNLLSARAIKASDFAESDCWQDFPLTFDVDAAEPSVEFRVQSAGTGDTITLDYVQLDRAR